MQNCEPEVIMARSLGWFTVLGVICALSTTATAQTSVCVEVQVRSWQDESADGPPADEGEQAATEAAMQDVERSPADPQAAEDAAGEPSSEAESGGTPPNADVEGVPMPAGAEDTARLGSGAPSAFDEDEFGGSGGPSTEPRRLFRPVAPDATPAQPERRLVPVASLRRAQLDPASYLRRLLEYRVTHREGFEAERSGCSERLRVQLYPLETGYTVFARYSGTSREEKVDEVAMDEFRALAERLESALLGDEPIESTLTRRTVLRADSEGEMRRIQGQRQFLFGIGTLLLAGELPTAPNATLPAENRIRLVAPLAINMGTRRAFRAWALDAYGGVVIGTSRKAASLARGGGHADYTFGMGMTLHFLRYLHPDAVNSFYGGGGASFQLHRYRILPNGSGSDAGVFGGGMNVDLVMGYEVMRASALHFFVETQAVLPAYQFESENSNGRVRSYIPGLLVQIGLLR